MKEISITGSGLRTICRLCLSSGVILLDIFKFSSKMRNSVASVIMKYAAVQITKGDGMPNFICQSCYTQVEKIHHFLMQIEQSDRTLRRNIQHYVSNKPIKVECFVQPFEEPSIHYTNKDIPVKYESLELNTAFNIDLNWKRTDREKFNQENKHEEVCIKSESNVELMDVNLFLTTKCEGVPEDISSNIDSKEFSCKESNFDINDTKVREDMTVNLKETKQENDILTSKFIERTSLKSEIKFEPTDDNLITLTESVYNTVSASSNDEENEISYEDPKINFDHESEKSCLRFANVTEIFSKCDEAYYKHISVYRQKHKKTNKLKGYQCDFCCKYFTDRSGLYTHKRTHTGDKPYKCNVCKKCFSQSPNLNRHKRIHTGEKPYQCDFCDKCFSDSSTLNKHTRIHTGEKPYQCDICNRCFSQSSNLNKHRLAHS